ncbi:GNAT family N-acetyltransferase [Burkholderia ubonensis]|uniref:GNAT family N-acetyltransferase n=1 Tax=Burkholderia ubonensis TaxID=101571 RepID=A0AB74D466_9BURK|nr:GNAT family N-acetyltransferase [Burkholderia ubonensis]PAJ79043.1 GNAT family N-acetyltransferase [Burkholderia ubonensis]PAJ85533.1 GNAT family N-acetyltransferase [Burkholderia ubonensis]PAJ95193.1 GNAT family N-acetyltransferase [Burkholderia ubonensis]PAJ99590.1 GNAT family N-acetyltransferase [Burkholderia ubonensis]PAK06339.1 GNAT family N-acetyltransferase [Burkholderia ubonensis]
MITIRLLDAADAALFQSLRLRAVETSPTSFLPTRDEEAGVSVAEFATRITPTPSQAVFGAFEVDTLVGITGVRRDARTKVAHKATIWGVFVDPAYRGRGIAQSLLERATAHAAQAWQCRQLLLCVNEINGTAERLYASQGFVRFGTEPRSLFVDGRFYDEHHMVKTLA